MNKEDIIINLEKHETRDVKDEHTNGTLTVVWRDWDKVILEEPKMVYVSTINPGEIKGPHLHKKRNSYFSCIHGKVTFIIKNDDGEYLEIETNADEPILLRIPNGIASAHINTTNEIGRVLAIADIAWRPNDNEMENVVFDDYDWKKWK
jgi:dTDP-4-dehydrorhamnose 3,5-epimerase-like enzyme